MLTLLEKKVAVTLFSGYFPTYSRSRKIEWCCAAPSISVAPLIDDMAAVDAIMHVHREQIVILDFGSQYSMSAQRIPEIHTCFAFLSSYRNRRLHVFL
jgi:hypothetical protein